MLLIKVSLLKFLLTECPQVDPMRQQCDISSKASYTSASYPTVVGCILREMVWFGTAAAGHYHQLLPVLKLDDVKAGYTTTSGAWLGAYLLFMQTVACINGYEKKIFSCYLRHNGSVEFVTRIYVCLVQVQCCYAQECAVWWEEYDNFSMQWT